MDTVDESKADALHYASRSGNAAMVAALLSAGADVHGLSAKDAPLPPLHIAARNGHLDVCRRLIQAGARVSAASQVLGRRPLHWAALSGKPQLLSYLIEAGAEVDDVDVANRTALMLAVEHGTLECTTMLLAFGADANIAEKRMGWTPLHQASKHGHHVAVAVLAAKSGTRVNICDSGKRTALHWAAFSGDLSSVLMLLEHGADPAARDNGGCSPGMVAHCMAAVEVAAVLVAKAGPLVPSEMIQGNHLNSYWASLPVASACQSCERKFGMTVWRVHCHGCRGTFCTKCTAKRPPPGSRFAGQLLCGQCLQKELVLTQPVTTGR